MKGFTLVETLVYISLFGLLMGGAVVSTYQILDGGARMNRALTVQEEGSFILRKLDWEVGQANSATIEDGTLMLQPGNIIFADAEGRMTIARDGEDVLPITAATLVVSHAVFTLTPGRVHAEFDVEGEHFVFERSLAN